MPFHKLLSVFSLVTLLSYPCHLHAEEEGDPLNSVQISNGEILKSLEMMKANGQISAEDYEKAKTQLQGMSPTQIKALEETAKGMIRNDPDKAVELAKGKKLDSGAVQKKINDLSRPKED